VEEDSALPDIFCYFTYYKTWVIEVNGSGISGDIIEDIFVPF